MANILRKDLSRRDLIRRGSATATGIAFAPKSALALGTFFDTGVPYQTTKNQSPYDVVIYGATIGAINAAYVLTRYFNRKVAVLQHDWFGGMIASGGLVNFDLSFPNKIGGVFWQQYQEMALMTGYGGGKIPSNWPTLQQSSTTPGNPGYVNAQIPGSQTPDGVTTLSIMNQFFVASGADYFTGAALTTTGGSVFGSVKMVNNAISSISTNAGVFSAKVFIDASYEGDLMAAANVPYVIGRESSAQYGETHAGVQNTGNVSLSGSYLLQPNGTPYFPVVANPGLSNGTADSSIQAYNFRPIIRSIANGAVPFYQPAGYNDALYPLVGKWFVAKNITAVSSGLITTYPLVNNKWNYNDPDNPFGGFYNQGWSYPDATPTQRQVIYNNHKNFLQGFLWYCANDPRAGAALNANVSLYGYANDEFLTSNHFPQQLYIREGRRMVGDTIMQESQTASNTTSATAIGWGTYVYDCHGCVMYASNASNVVLDGLFFISSGFGPFQIPMTNLIPNTGSVTNLIVPVCCSVSHSAWGPIRMEATFALKGEGAACMADAMIANAPLASQNINYTTQLLPRLNAINARPT